MALRRPRIGMHVLGTGNGGIWRYVHAILARIDLREFDVLLFSDIQDVYAPRPEISLVPLTPARPANSPPRAPDLLKPDAKRERAPANPKDRLLGPLKLWAGAGRESWRLAAVFRGRQLRLLHTNQTGCEEAPIAARMAKVPRVLGTFHIDPTYDLAGRRSGFRHRALEHVSNHCLSVGIGVSRRTSRDWIERTHLPERKVVTIHNGIDPGQFRRRTAPGLARNRMGIANDVDFVIGGIGRLEEAKGFEYLISAVPGLLRRFPKLLLLIAGDGPLREALQGQAAQLGVEGHVRFAGYQRDVQAVLDCLDVFVLPSLCETLGYAFLEAMATCVPTVGTTVGGVPEVIVHGETGLLVPPRDPTALASAIATLIDSGELRTRMGRAARERVIDNFDESQMVRRTIDLYRRVLA